MFSVICQNICLVSCKLLCYTPTKNVISNNYKIKKEINTMNEEKIELINKYKKEKNAVILAHYYVAPEIQAVADYIGDSFYLSKLAVSLDNPVIVFCGVEFMGESAKLLNPEKTVLLPEPSADCPMAHMVTKDIVDAARAQYDDLAVVCYINSTAKIKSWSDVCVTSANAAKIVSNLPNKNILFIPDKNLGNYVASLVPNKKFIFNEGFCPRHEYMSSEELLKLKEEHPNAKILVHPECNEAIRKIADYIGSTSGIINYAKEHTKENEFIIGTVIGVIYELEQKRPDAKFYFPATTPVCANMAKITLDNLLHVLKTGDNSVDLPSKEIADAAKQTLTRMLELAK